MKKFFLVTVFCLMMICITMLVGCDNVGYNRQVFDLNYGYTNAYVKIGDEWKDLEIKSWYDYEGEQLQITLKDGTVMLVSSYYCILYKGTSPETK